MLPGVLIDLMRDIGMPNGLYAVGYDERDVDSLVEGALAQQRLLATSPRAVLADDLEGIFTRSMSLWDQRKATTRGVGGRGGAGHPRP